MTTGLSHEQLSLAIAGDIEDRYIALVGASHRLQIVLDRLLILSEAAAAKHGPIRRPRIRRVGF